MTISVQTPFVGYVGNGSTKIFPYTFKITTAADLSVYLNNIVQSTGFTISGIGVESGGNVTFTTAPASGVVVEFKRNVPLARTTDYLTSGTLEADTLDDDIDRVVMMMQDVKYNILAGTSAVNWADVTGKPTTLSGYGISDAASSSHNHTGVYQPVGSYALTTHDHDGIYQPVGSYALDTHNHTGIYQPVGSYLTANQSITLSGDATGSGTTAITVTLGTVPTTKGGTGLTTLGTGLQVLRTNSGATAMEWATISAGVGDAVLANTQTFTGTNTFSNPIIANIKTAANNQLTFTNTTSAVNYVNMTHSATGNAPAIAATGTDTNVGLALAGKGTGDITLNGYSLAQLLNFEISFQLQVGANATFTVSESSNVKYKINSVSCKTDSGSISAAININGTGVTGLTALSLTTTTANSTATALNTVNVGDRLTVVTSSNATAVNSIITIKCSRII